MRSIFLILLLTLCITRTAATEAQDLRTEGHCSYGIQNAPVGRVISLGVALCLTLAFSAVLWILVVGLVLQPALGCVSFACAYALCPLLFDTIVLNFPTWEYFGPGNAYVRGVTGNDYLKGAHILAAVLNKIYTILVIAFFTSLEEQQWKARLGTLISIGSAAFVTWRGFTSGVVSYYIGGDSNNPEACSGPQSWAQLNVFAKFTELAFFLGPMITFIPSFDLPFAFAELICAVLVLKNEQMAYHRATAAYDLVLSIVQLACSFKWSRTSFRGSKAKIASLLGSLSRGSTSESEQMSNVIAQTKEQQSLLGTCNGPHRSEDLL